MEKCYLEPPCEDFINCFVCGKKIDIADSFHIADDIEFCNVCFDFSVRYNIDMIKQHITDKDNYILLCDIIDILDTIQKENTQKK